MHCLFDCCVHRDLLARRRVKGIFEYYENGGGSALKEKKERKHSFLLTVDKSSPSQAVKQFYDLQFQDF